MKNQKEQADSENQMILFFMSLANSNRNETPSWEWETDSAYDEE